MHKSRLVIAALAVALVQIGFLGWIIAGRAAILRDGREVLFHSKPVDPRDLLRGDYVVLEYEIDRLSASLLAVPPEKDAVTREGPIHVRLSKGADGYWHAVSASLYEPFAVPPSADEVDIAGKVEAGRPLGPGLMVDVDYGLGRFYVPEGEGRVIEDGMRARGMTVKVAVAPDGTAQIKALIDEQTTLYEEPPF